MQQLKTLASGAFLETATNVLAFGLPGVGKSHGLCAVGHALVEAGRSVLCVPAYALVQELLGAKRDLDLPRALRKLDLFEGLRDDGLDQGRSGDDQEVPQPDERQRPPNIPHGDPSPLLRRCMIVGTTNDPRCLPNDASGNRRFMPVPCDAGDPASTRAYLDEHREQLWAEAIYRIRENRETAYLPDSLKAPQALLTEQYRAVDEVAEDVIGSWLASNPQVVTTNQVATGIGWTPDSRSIYRITTVLKQMNYTRSKKSIDGAQKWVWTPPGGPAQLEF